MKMGLIKKSFICVLSLSFITLLVACNKNKDGVVSKTNVFAKKDVLAYAKKNKEEKDNGNVEIAVFDTNDYTVSFEDSLYALVCDNTSKYYLYLKCNNKLVDLKNDTTEYIVEINKKLTYGSNYGYYEISYSNGDYMIIDYDGEVVATKSGINNFTYQRFSNNLNNYTGEVIFYDSIKYHNTVDNKDVELLYKVVGNVDGGILTTYTKTQISSKDEIDYSVFDNNNEPIKLKNYDVYFDSDSVIVKDLKGNIKSTFLKNNYSNYYLLDDKLFYQSSDSVSFGDDYTYSSGSNYYLLKTYQVDLTTGKTKEIKNFGYLLSTSLNVYGYNEKNDREYVAGIYNTLTKITNKRLESISTTAMLDENGKILSNKVGEKGYSFKYMNDNTYVLFDGITTSILDKKGNTKANYISSGSSYQKKDIYIDYQNELFFIPSSSGSTNYGYVYDSNLKKIDYYGVKEFNWYARYSNGNCICSVVDGIALINFNNKKVNEIERYDFDNFTTTFTPYKVIVEGCKYVMTNDYLTENNLYVVQIKTESGWNIEIHDANGNNLKTIEDVTNITFDSSYALFMAVTTTTTTYRIGATLSSNLD